MHALHRETLPGEDETDAHDGHEQAGDVEKVGKKGIPIGS